MDIRTLARPEILAMRPYASARSSMSAEGILLNANEAPRALLDELDFAQLAINRYPPPQPQALRERLERQQTGQDKTSNWRDYLGLR